MVVTALLSSLAAVAPVAASVAVVGFSDDGRSALLQHVESEEYGSRVAFSIVNGDDLAHDTERVVVIDATKSRSTDQRACRDAVQRLAQAAAGFTRAVRLHPSGCAFNGADVLAEGLERVQPLADGPALRRLRAELGAGAGARVFANERGPLVVAIDTDPRDAGGRTLIARASLRRGAGARGAAAKEASPPAAAADDDGTTVRARRAAACSGAVMLMNDERFLPHAAFLTKALSTPFLAAGYDKQVYLETVGFTPAAERTALVGALDDMRRAHCVVDLFLVTRRSVLLLPWLEALAPGALPRLRIIYDASSAVFDLQEQRLLALGARAVVAHGDNSFGFVLAFLPAWLEGKPLRQTVKRASATLHEALIIGDAEIYWYGAQPHIVGDEHVLFRRRDAFDP